MKDIRKLRKIAPDEAQKLKDQGIATLEELWETLGEDEVQAVQRVAVLTGLDEVRLIQLLVAEGVWQNRKNRGFWLVRHWFDLALGVGVLFVLVFGSLAAGIWALPTEAATQAFVHTKAGLEAFQPIASSEVEMRPTMQEIGGFEAIDDVVGRFTLRDVEPNTVLRRQDLSEIPPDTLAGRQLISLRVKPGVLRLQPGQRITLLFSPRPVSATAVAPEIVENVLVLSAVRTEEHTTIVAAVTPEQISKMVRVLGASEVHVARPVPWLDENMGH